MKKIFLVLIILMATGCKNKLTCTLETVEDDYSTKEKIVFNFENKEKAFEASVDHIMTFKNEETAKLYLNIFEALDEGYEISLEGNKINIKSFKNYEQYGTNRDELKKELELNGYLCK